MNYTFADRVQSLKPSAIREILKYSSDPAVVPFSAGNPAPEAFPIEAVKEIVTRIFSEHPVEALQYSLTEGYPALRARLTELAERYAAFRLLPLRKCTVEAG